MRVSLLAPSYRLPGLATNMGRDLCSGVLDVLGVVVDLLLIPERVCCSWFEATGEVDRDVGGRTAVDGFDAAVCMCREER